MKKLNKKLIYNPGIINNKNELVLMKGLQMAFDKIDELIDEIEALKQEVKNEKEKVRSGGH